MKSLKIIPLFILISSTFIGSCKKDESPPTVTTVEISDITESGAKSGGIIISDGGKKIISKGVCWSTSNDPTISDSKTNDGSGTESYSSTITGLNAGTVYYVKAYATNSIGTGYGKAMAFKTIGELPFAETMEATNILEISATLNAVINPNYLSTVVTFEYGLNTSYGNNVTAIQSPLMGGANAIVNADITGLVPGTLCHFRVKVVNDFGTIYGRDLSFTSAKNNIIFNPNLNYGTVSDIDGNVYKTILIGNQTWMAQNLKTTKFRNGNIIGTTSPDTLDISGENTPKYQWAFNGDVSNVVNYGRLYTWYAITDNGGICPTGWHVPTDSEWNTLIIFLGGANEAGGKLKETGTVHWSDPNTGATNFSGFTGLPGGYRYANGECLNISYRGPYWSSTERVEGGAWYRLMTYTDTGIGRYYDYKSAGFSVRCIKD